MILKYHLMSQENGKWQIPNRYPIYKYDGAYTQAEISQVGEFMHAEFPSVVIEARGMKFTVEYPPSYICGPNTWNYYLGKILKPEIDVLHPRFRNKPTIVRFVPVLNDIRDGTGAGATGNVRDDEYWVRIPYESQNGKTKSVDEILFLIMHEITESDFWAKTQKGDTEAYVDGKLESEYFKSADSANYRNLLDEKIANRRALRAIQRVFTESSLVHSYEEDQ